VSWIRQGELLIRHYLKVDPAEDFDVFQVQFSEALWMEERIRDVMAGAIGKALGGK
jgi:hypothetical protein